jgi:ABC-type polysaccharide/polyol phosphate transport system ATPase subunit
MTETQTEALESAGTEEAAPASASGAPGHVLVAAHDVSKAYPRATRRGGLAGRLLGRLEGGADAPDEDEDDEDEDLDDEERAAGWILRDVDLELRAGTATGVVGPPSSGKTTLMEILAGLTPPTSGRVVQSGRVIPILDALPKLMQDGSAWRNVVLLARVLGHSRGWARERIEPIFEFAGLTGSENRPRKAMPVAEVQKLAVATMLHVEGRVYLVDSSLGGRDRAFRERCLEFLAEKQAAGAAIVHTGRELEGVQRLCDDVLWLERGVVLTSGRPEQVAAFVRGRRAEARRGPGGPLPSRETEQLLQFLRVAVGDVLANDAFHAARDAAESAGQDRIDWPELAVAAGYDISEAQRIVDRLTRRSSGGVPVVPSFNEQAAIVGATASRQESGDLELRITVEAAVAGLDLGCAVVFVDDAGRLTRIEQPEPYAADRPGIYEVEVTVPTGMLAPGAHRATVLVGVVSGTSRTLLFRRDLLSLDLVEPGAEPAGDEVFDGIEPYDPADLDVEVGRSEDLEWHVRRAE